MDNKMDQVLRRIEQARKDLAARKQHLEAVRAKNKEAFSEHRKEIERMRRAGEMGQAWQVLQSRIDLGRTCENDIFGGIDKSPEAREVRATLVSNLVKMQTEAEQLGADAEENQPYTAALESVKKLQAMEAGMRKDI